MQWLKKQLLKERYFIDYSNLESQIKQNEKERELIISQLKDAKKGGAKTQTRTSRRQEIFSM